MAPIVINRNPWSALVDDSGNNLDGSLWDKLAIKTVLLDPIDTALAAVPVDAATGKIPDSALSANVALRSITNQFVPVQNFSAGLNAGATSVFSGTALQATAVIYADAGISLRGGILGFPAAQIASSDPNTLDDYEEGVWAPTDASGAGLVFAGVTGIYVKVGALTHVAATLTFPTTANGLATKLGSFPFPFPAAGNIASGSIGYTDVGTLHTILGPGGGTSCTIYNLAGAPIPNATYSAKTLVFSFSYRTAT